jgi:formylglycine-generating enzyme required for sulfatase activity
MRESMFRTDLLQDKRILITGGGTGRGGSWRHQIKVARCSARSSIPPEFQYADYGFRVACGR